MCHLWLEPVLGRARGKSFDFRRDVGQPDRSIGGLSRRGRFPSLRELYSGALGRFEPNPDLRSETLLGAEAGHHDGGWGEVDASNWHATILALMLLVHVSFPESTARTLNT